MLVTVLIIVALALMGAVQKLDREIYTKSTNLRESIANNLLTTVKDRFETNAVAISDTITTMMNSKLIAYCIITDPEDTNVLFTTVKDTLIMDGQVARNTLQENNLTNTGCIIKKTDKFNM